MIKAYKLKIYPNKGKAKKLDELLNFWQDEVNRKIRMFWQFENVKASYPPKEYTKGGRLVRDASVKAWKIVKGAKKTGQTEEPFFTVEEIDINEFSGNGNDLRDLRIRTKWRSYKKGLSAFKQGLNRVAKKIAEAYKGCDFAVEKLLFKGKRGRSRIFRRRNNNCAYSYLSHRLEEIGCSEGFRVLYINPRDTSRRCPQCGEGNKSNRRGELFLCAACDFTAHADRVGAMNLALKSREEHPSLGVALPENFSIFVYKTGGE